MLLYLYLEQLGLVTINKFCIAAEGRSGFALPTARPEGEAGLVKPVPASVTAGSASALSACQIQWLRWLRPPLINKFNNKEGSDQIKLNLNKNNKYINRFYKEIEILEKADNINIINDGGNNQNDILFNLGKDISNAPIITGNI